MNDLNYYEILGVDVHFTRDQLKAAYHSKLFQTHPDKRIESRNSDDLDGGDFARNENGGSRNSSSVEEIKVAYAVLADNEKRAAYDIELAEQSLKSGLNFTGAGLDEYTLEEFEYLEIDGKATWMRDCPRCTSTHSMVLSEEDLEEGSPDGTGGFHIAVSCQTCSLWITVSYEEEGCE